jgi:hypothetical protein
MHIKVGNHLLDDAQLLPVFLPEIRFMWQNDVKQLVYDSGYAPEMAGAFFALQYFGYTGRFHPGAVAVRVHAIWCGHKDDVNALFFKQRKVAPGMARVLGKILAGAELSGINENTHYSNVVFPLGTSHQGEVPFM